jgi:hypothetical protein
MTISDDWLLERAHARTGRMLKGHQGLPRAPRALPPVDALWAELQKETKRQAKVYTDAVGDPEAVVIDTPPDAIDVRVPDGRHLTLRLDRETGRLFETFRDQAGAVRMRKPIISFALNSDGEVAFNFGGLLAAAGSILRRMIG